MDRVAAWAGRVHSHLRSAGGLAGPGGAGRSGRTALPALRVPGRLRHLPRTGALAGHRPHVPAIERLRTGLRAVLRPSRALTVVLVPPGGAHPRTVRIPILPLQVGAAALGVVLAVSLGGSALAVHDLALQNRSLRGALGRQTALTHIETRGQVRAQAEDAYFAQQTASLTRDAQRLQTMEASVRSVLAAAGIQVPVPVPAGGQGGGGAATLGSLSATALSITALPPGQVAALTHQARATNLSGAPVPAAHVAGRVLQARHVLGTIGGQLPVLSQDLAALARSLGGWQRAAMDTPSIWPVIGPITSPFGWRPDPFGHGPAEFHEGVDIGVPVGTRVHATADGVVEHAGWDGAYGNAVIIDHGNGLQTLYGHNSQILVRVGESITKGQVIAISGDTGRSTGPHVHYGVYLNGRAVNPATYLPGD